MSRRILVLDGDAGAAVSITQSLGRAGYHVTLGATSFEHRAFRSRFVATPVLYPDPLVDKTAFQDWIVAHREHALVIPATERTLMPLHEIRDHAVLQGRLAIPPPEATTIGFDKEQVRALAEQIGIAVPANLVVARLAELASPLVDLWLERGAVVIKSIYSKVWDQDGGKELVVRMAVDREQVAQFGAQLLESGPIQLQQWVPGHGRGIEVLVDRGETVLAFAHERLHELPLTGGGSCYRRAIAPPPELLASAQRLLGALGWHGVAMVEFRHDPLTGASYMMELNGRFWGSLPLAQFAGVDFPVALVELLLDGKRPAPVVPRPVYARSLRRDLEWLRQNTAVRTADVRRRGPVPPERRLMLVRPVVRSVAEWSRLLFGREALDGAALDDLGPIAWEVRAQLASTREWLLAKWRTRQVQRAAIAAWDAPLGNVERVLVLCRGNICRSAYAGVKLAAVAADRLEVRGGGFFGPGGRASPEMFARVAARRGIDLSGHRSYVITDADLAWADLILIMDANHHRALATHGAAVLAKARWLGGVIAEHGSDPTIADPIDFGAAGVEGVLDQLDAALAAVLARVGGGL